ncbi:hypothetical protein HYH03_002960 [Edaphochlamys debaryana]|uniref:Rhodanese domain-containing protein n=1 Tax=Edaphochlamys debaryana TaxID=47281 RepID=A0A835YIT8_9CHLO|nr:hypothetical protein HYH03_002960 [Edaphochlamys debaryana]|eukprot:KAG2499385.1 hypothetical protein HYH03_002960 [Edaphochlamys debaryana]
MSRPVLDEPKEVGERFLDVEAMLQNFDPLNGDHLLQWGSDEDEDEVRFAQPGTLAEATGAWEDEASGYAGHELFPAHIDYGAGSESEDEGTAHSSPLSSASAALLSTARPAAAASASLPAEPLPSAYTSEAGFLEIPVHELQERLLTGQFAVLLDVRSRAEYDGGHVAGAMCLPLDTDLSTAVRSGQLDEYRSQPIAIICATGARSSQATVRLSKVFGFSNVYNVKGGFKAWRAEGHPVAVTPGALSGSGGGGCGCGGGGSGGCGSKKQ